MAITYIIQRSVIFPGEMNYEDNTERLYNLYEQLLTSESIQTSTVDFWLASFMRWRQSLNTTSPSTADMVNAMNQNGDTIPYDGGSSDTVANATGGGYDVVTNTSPPGKSHVFYNRVANYSYLGVYLQNVLTSQKCSRYQKQSSTKKLCLSGH